MMRTILMIILTVALAAAAHAEEVQCLRAIDGDSLLVLARGLRVQVRLVGVDAPESRQEFGKEAKAFTKEVCAGGALDLEFDEEMYDRYNRILAYAWRDGAMLNEELVRAGLAVPYPYPPNTKYALRFEAAEKEAMRTGRGFWAQGGLEQSPKEWRRSRR